MRIYPVLRKLASLFWNIPTELIFGMRVRNARQGYVELFPGASLLQQDRIQRQECILVAQKRVALQFRDALPTCHMGVACFFFETRRGSSVQP